MTHSLAKIICKDTDYKLCSHCDRINWYENEVCIDCGHSYFKGCGEGVEDAAHELNDSYEAEGYIEEEIDNILIDV